jgi:hypothetical protein
MHRTLRSARTAAALALTLGVALVLPGAAFAGTTEPTPVTTTSTTSTTSTGTTSTTAEPSGSASSTTTDATGSTPSTTGSTSSDPTSTSSATSSTTPTTSPTTSATKASAKAASKKQMPFGARSALRAAVVPGDPSDQALQAAGFIVRTLAARDDHYNYPASTYFDGGNTIDAILGLDGAGAGLDQADASTEYLAANIGGYNGTGFGSVYAGPTAKAVLGVVAHGGDATAFGGHDLLDELTSTLGAVTPGRFSDLPADCGDADPATDCDYSNTIGQALAVIALGRATGSVPQEAGDYLLDQQCADGGFRGNLDAASGACTADADATAFAAQAVIGLLGADDPAAVDALQWLASHQTANGGFLNQDGQYNANTAAVAAQAFAAGGLTPELTRAQGFLTSLQLDCAFATALRGGIAFTAADRATLKATPTNTKAIDRALRATPQATLALAGGSLLTVTADGAAATAPALTCSTTTATTTTTTTTTTGAAGPRPTAAAPASADPADPASATPGSLAYTGADVAALSLLGALLLVAGAGAIVLARRKGVHA